MSSTAEHPTADAGPAATAPTRPPAPAWPWEHLAAGARMVAERLPWAEAPARALGLPALSPRALSRELPAPAGRARAGRPVSLRTPAGSFVVTADADEGGRLLADAAAAGALGPAVAVTAAGRRRGLSAHAAPPAGADREVSDPAWAPWFAAHARALSAARLGDATVGWEAWRAEAHRLARRLVVGEAAAEDTLLTHVVFAAAADLGHRGGPDRAAALRRRLTPYLTSGDPAELPRTAHLLALVSEAAAGTAWQALGLLAGGHGRAEDTAGARGLVERALLWWPPLDGVAHPVRTAFPWGEVVIPAGAEVLHRPGRPVGTDPAAVRVAHGAADPASTALCGGPEPCAAAGIAVGVAAELVRAVAARTRPLAVSPALDPRRPPTLLDPADLVLALPDREPPVEAVGPEGSAEALSAGSAAPPARSLALSPAAHGILARAEAERLERHADRLAACAEHPGWSADEAGERARLALLDHAVRCSRAAEDVRRAAHRLTD
ncbi:hypothetical protein ACN20G_01645 [Streptomyces sp. BI20]|uniref:hypothetical protein n=1 Tax=Streptomyces sp. BI20 TaxID=3403460 RepID=UPI003C720707